MFHFLAKWYKYEGSFDELVKNDEEFVRFLMQNLRWNDLTARTHIETLRTWYFKNLPSLSVQQIRDRLATVSNEFTLYITPAPSCFFFLKIGLLLLFKN